MAGQRQKMGRFQSGSFGVEGGMAAHGKSSSIAVVPPVGKPSQQPFRRPYHSGSDFRAFQRPTRLRKLWMDRFLAEMRGEMMENMCLASGAKPLVGTRPTRDIRRDTCYLLAEGINLIGN